MDTKKQVEILGHPISIQLTNLDDNYGDFDPALSLIRICETLSLRRKGETLLHEAGHSFATSLSDTELGHALWDSLSAQAWHFLWENGLIHEGNLSRLLDD